MTEMNAPAVTATEVVLPGKVEPSGLRLVQRALPPPAAQPSGKRSGPGCAPISRTCSACCATACSPPRSPPATRWPKWPRPWSWPSPPAGPPSARSSWCPDGDPPAREPPRWKESFHKAAVSAGSRRLSNATE